MLSKRSVLYFALGFFLVISLTTTFAKAEPYLTTNWTFKNNPSTSGDVITGVCEYGNYIYAVGYTTNEGDGDTSGSSALIYKLDRNGNLIATLTWEPIDANANDDSDGLQDCEVVNGYLYVVGYHYDTTAVKQKNYVGKVDLSSFSVVNEWTPTISNSTAELLTSIASDGTYLFVVGHASDVVSSSSSYDLQVLKLDLNANILESYFYDAYTAGTCRSGTTGSNADYGRKMGVDGNYVYVSSDSICVGDWGGDGIVDDYDYITKFLKLDKNLNLIGEYIKNYYVSTAEGSSAEITLTFTISENNIYLFGYYNPVGGYYRGYLIKLDKNLNEVNTTEVDEGSSIFFLKSEYYSTYNFIIGRKDTTYAQIKYWIIDENLVVVNSSEVTSDAYNHYITNGKMVLNTTEDRIYTGWYDYETGDSQHVVASFNINGLNKAPSITINSPLNQSYSETSLPNLEFVVTDAENSTFWVKAYVDSNLVYDNSSYINNTLVTIDISSYLNIGQHNVTVWANDTDASSPQISEQTVWFRIEGDSQLNLTASPSWQIVEGESIQITCSARSGLTVTLYKDGVIVPNPYTASLPYGSYNFTCEIDDKQNYEPDSVSNILKVVSGGYGCSSPDIYTYELNVTTSPPLNLNFTELVNQGIVRKDLKDVWVNTSSVTAYKNTTNGYYLVVTSATTPFTVRFGNYMGNNTYSDASLETTTINVENYTLINSYYIYGTLLNEISGGKMLPPNATTTISLYCSSGYTSFQINDTEFLVPTKVQADQIRAIVEYSPTEVYYRDYLVRSPIEYKNIYLVDATQNQVVQMLFRLQDYTGSFTNSILKVKRYLEGTLRTITELYFDVEDKAIVFLANGHKYQLYVDNGQEERNIGEIYVDPTDLEKTIVLGQVQLTNLTQGNVTYSLGYDAASNTIYGSYRSQEGNIISAEFKVIDYDTGTTLYYASSTNKTEVSFAWLVNNTSKNYYAELKVNDAFFGEFSKKVPIYLTKKQPEFPLLDMITNLGGSVVWLAILFILPIPLFFTERYVELGALFTLAFVALLTYWGVLNVSQAVLGIGILIVILIFINRGKR